MFIIIEILNLKLFFLYLPSSCILLNIAFFERFNCIHRLTLIILLKVAVGGLYSLHGQFIWRCTNRLLVTSVGALKSHSLQLLLRDSTFEISGSVLGLRLLFVASSTRVVFVEVGQYLVKLRLHILNLHIVFFLLFLLLLIYINAHSILIDLLHLLMIPLLLLLLLQLFLFTLLSQELSDVLELFGSLWMLG